MSLLLDAPPTQTFLDDDQVWKRVLDFARSYASGKAGPGARWAPHPAAPRRLDAAMDNVYVRCETIDDSRPGVEVVVVAIERDTSPFPPASALQKRFRLTRREAQVALLVAERRSTQEIAEMLFVTRHTVRRHIEKVMLKLGVSRRTDVRHVLAAMKRGEEVGTLPSWRRAVGA